MKMLTTLHIMFCSTIMIVAGCSPMLTETHQPASAIEITTFPSTLKIDDIRLEFTSYKRDAQNFTIVICFDPPAEEVSHFEDVIFKVDDKEILDAKVIMGSGLGRADGFDCGYIYYPNELIPRAGNANLSIGRLRQYLNRKNNRIADCNRAQKKLDTATTGIVITCDPAIVDQHYRFFVVTQKPASISDEDAELIAWDAFSEFRDVDWRFSFRIDEP